MSITVIDAVARIRPDGMSETVGAIGSVRSAFLLLPLAIAGAGAVLVKMGMDAQTQLSIVAGLTGSSAAQMRYYTSSLEAMGARFGMTLDESAKGLYYVVSAGFSGADAINVLTAAMLHAAATGVPLKDVANGLTSAMNAYGASADQATRYSDILTTAITYGKQTTADFANNVSKAALMAASAHVPFTQLAAAEAALTEKGEPANRAFTELSFLMSKIAVPSAQAMTDAVDKLGGHLDTTAYSSADLMGKLLLLRYHTGLTTDEFLKLIGGTRSSRAALGLLTDGGAAYDRILQQMANDSGATAAAFDIHTHTMGFAFDRVKAAISNAGYALVQMISPQAIDFLNHIADAAGKLPDLFTTIGNLVGPAFGLLGDKLVYADASSQGYSRHGRDTNDMLVTQHGILSRVRDYLVSTYGPAWQKISDFVTASLVPAFKQFADFVLTKVLPVLQQMWQWFAAQILPILLSFATFILTKVVPALENLWNWFVKNILPVLERFATFIVRNVVPALEGLWTWFQAKVLPILQQAALIIAQTVIPAFQSIWNTIQTQLIPALQKLWDQISPVIIPVLKALAWTFTNVVVPAIQTAITWISNIIDKVSGLIGHIKDLIDWLGHLADKLTGVGGGITGWNPTAGAHKAQGGAASGLTLVGEQGPELAVFPPGTNIIPAGQTRAILSGSGAPSTASSLGFAGLPNVPININIGGTRVAQVLLPELVAAMRHGGAIRA